ncbi:MAG: amidase [Pseudobdellovibrionaceae bacterium]
MSQIFEMSTQELVRKMKKKELSPLELIHSTINKIENENSRLNAVCERFYEQALTIAKQKTELMTRMEPDEYSTLFGIPFSIKEMFSFEGAKRTAGNIHYKDHVAKKTSTLVSRLIEAGGIPLVTTNVPELGFWYECYNPIYGQTNNPYNKGRTSGGSSGGECALIGAGTHPIGIGSDIGGSIRMPAYFCGVFGHKPTENTIPITGHFPYDFEQFKETNPNQYTNTAAGPITRRAEDLEVMFEIMCGADGIDPATKTRQEVLVNKNKFAASGFQLSQIKVYHLNSPEIHLASLPDQDVSEKVSQVAQAFLELGCSIQELDPRFFVRSVELWFNEVKKRKSDRFSDLLNPHGKINYTKELFKIARGQPNYTFSNLAVAMIENLAPDKDQSVQLSQEHENLKQELLKKLDDRSVLILPVHPRPAPKHNHAKLTPFDFIYTGIFTTLGFPAVTVPLGLNSEGLPMGVQIVARPYCDHLCFRLATVLENLFGGWVKPAS